MKQYFYIMFVLVLGSIVSYLEYLFFPALSVMKITSNMYSFNFFFINTIFILHFIFIYLMFLILFYLKRIQHYPRSLTIISALISFVYIGSSINLVILMFLYSISVLIPLLLYKSILIFFIKFTPITDIEIHFSKKKYKTKIFFILCCYLCFVVIFNYSTFTIARRHNVAINEFREPYKFSIEKILSTSKIKKDIGNIVKMGPTFYSRSIVTDVYWMGVKRFIIKVIGENSSGICEIEALGNSVVYLKWIFNNNETIIIDRNN